MPAIWLGGCLFGASILMAGYLRTGYSHLRQSISELAARNAPYSWMIRWMGFIPLGFSFVLFAQQTRELFASFIPTVLLLLTGLAVLVAGIFPTDPDNRHDTLSSKVHEKAVMALLFLLSATPFAFSISGLYRVPPEVWFLIFSFLMGVAILGFFGMLPNDAYPWLVTLHRKIFGRFVEIWYPLQGLHQRLHLLLFGIWWIVFTLVLTNP